MPNLSPKILVVQAVTELLQKKDVTALDRYWEPSYIQHNPTLLDGVEVIKNFVPATQSFAIHRAIEEGDYVVTHAVATGWGPQPMIMFDIFRVQDGKLAEHWDVMTPQAAQTVSGRTQLDGPTEVTDIELTAVNKQKVQEFFDAVLYGGQMDKITNYINPTTYLQHNPAIGDGLASLGQALGEMAQAGQPLILRKTHRIIAEGNFVFTHSEGEFGGKHVAFADLFRLENGLIVEHWDTIQEVPAQANNSNGVF